MPLINLKTRTNVSNKRNDVELFQLENRSDIMYLDHSTSALTQTHLDVAINKITLQCHDNISM